MALVGLSNISIPDDAFHTHVTAGDKFIELRNWKCRPVAAGWTSTRGSRSVGHLGH